MEGREEQRHCECENKGDQCNTRLICQQRQSKGQEELVNAGRTQSKTEQGTESAQKAWTFDNSKKRMLPLTYL